MNYSQARDALADLFDAAMDHLPTQIERRRSGEAVLISSDDLRDVLERYEFTPQVYFEAGAVSVWLPELAVWGRGSDLAGARTDLLAEVREYIEDFATDEVLRRAPNHRERAAWVLRARLLTDEDLDAALFDDPTQPEADATVAARR